MKNKKILLILLFFNLSFLTNAAIFIEKSLDQEINNSELIIEARLLDKYSKIENHIRTGKQFKNDGSVEVFEIEGTDVITTFIFKIKNIIKGQYDSDTIEVKMLGGCVNGNCRNISSNYEFSTNEEAVLFLKEDKKNNSFISTNASHTVFSISNDNGSLTRKSHSSISLKTKAISLSKENPISIDDIRKISNEK